VQKLFVRGGFADVGQNGFTILAEQAIPVAELDAARIDAEIKNVREDFEDAKTEEAQRLAAEKLSQLQELKAALGL
jgi:F-type H+-transporting ATPase subunit epsilon